MCKCPSTTIYMGRIENNLWESVLSYHPGPRDQTQVIKLGDKWPFLSFFNWLGFVVIVVV